MHSPARSSGKYSAEFTPYILWIFSSCSGRSMRDQSGRCSIFLPRIAREGKLALELIGKFVGPTSASGPSGAATAAGEKVAPSQRSINTKSQQSNRTAVKTMLSKTGRKSVGD